MLLPKIFSFLTACRVELCYAAAASFKTAALSKTPPHPRLTARRFQGTCARFNAAGTLKSTRSGAEFGLSVVLQTNVSEYLLSSTTAGFRVLAVNQVGAATSRLALESSMRIVGRAAVCRHHRRKRSRRDTDENRRHLDDDSSARRPVRRVHERRVDRLAVRAGGLQR